MDYVLKRGNRYYYNRRVPSDFKEFDRRRFVSIALKTDSPSEAKRLATAKNKLMEEYWSSLACRGQKYSLTEYEQAVQRAQTLGFQYLPNDKIADALLEKIFERLQHVKKEGFNTHHVNAVMGTVPTPIINLSNTLKRFFDYSKDKCLNKSPNQLRKWKSPRKRAIRNFIRVIGDKDITQITRDDTLKFRDWWITRIEKENLSAATANKNIIHAKSILELVSDNLGLNLDIRHLFRKLVLEHDEIKRRALTTDYILSTLLNPQKLSGLNAEARWVLHVFAETGAGFSELTGLMSEDIILDHAIPHICIVQRKNKKLKTKYRERKIPLVGFALDAFRAFPNGFVTYQDKPDSLSTMLSKYLRENDMLPSANHTVYSLRHSFQDRLLAAKVLDREQADLMGHKFNRPDYGDGTSLEQKLVCMRKIQLKNARLDYIYSI